MKLDILFICSIIGVGLALFLDKFFQSTYVKPVSTAAQSTQLTGDPVRDYMETHF